MQYMIVIVLLCFISATIASGLIRYACFKINLNINLSYPRFNQFLEFSGFVRYACFKINFQIINLLHPLFNQFFLESIYFCQEYDTWIFHFIKGWNLSLFHFSFWAFWLRIGSKSYRDCKTGSRSQRVPKIKSRQNEIQTFHEIKNWKCHTLVFKIKSPILSVIQSSILSVIQSPILSVVQSQDLISYPISGSYPTFKKILFHFSAQNCEKFLELRISGKTMQKIVNYDSEMLKMYYLLLVK